MTTKQVFRSIVKGAGEVVGLGRPGPLSAPVRAHGVARHFSQVGRRITAVTNREVAAHELDGQRVTGSR